MISWATLPWMSVNRKSLPLQRYVNLFVIQPHQVQDCGMEIVDVHWAFPVRMHSKLVTRYQ